MLNTIPNPRWVTNDLLDGNRLKYKINTYKENMIGNKSFRYQDCLCPYTVMME